MHEDQCNERQAAEGGLVKTQRTHFRAPEKNSESQVCLLGCKYMWLCNGPFIALVHVSYIIFNKVL